MMTVVVPFSAAVRTVFVHEAGDAGYQLPHPEVGVAILEVHQACMFASSYTHVPCHTCEYGTKQQYMLSPLPRVRKGVRLPPETSLPCTCC